MELREFVEKVTPLGVLGVIVEQNGEEIGRHLWEGACRRNIYSATKSFTAAAVGIAQKEGLLDIHEKLTDVFKEELPDNVSEHLEKAEVRDLLTMNLGQPESFLMGEFRPYYKEKDWVKLALAQPFTDDPETKFVYNNVGPYLAGILVQKRAGCDLPHYLMPRMFEKLDITLPTWEYDPMGRSFGAGGLFLTLDELHKFGRLYLNGGRVNGCQVVPENWVKDSMSPQAGAGPNEYGYGYLMWGGPHGSFRADGKYCQYTIVIPEKNAVITVVAECRRGGELNDAVWNIIYPQL